MTNRKGFSWKARAKSFRYAWDGLQQLFTTEHNSWIHFALTLVAFAAAVFFNISREEWISLIIVMTLVWMAELFNTALEKTMNFISVDYHPQIKKVKDFAAAAVLVAALAAVIVGCLIFIPKISKYV